MRINRTFHAEKRLQQRGFKKGDVDLITRFGTKLSDREADLFWLRSKDVGKAVRQLKRTIQTLERLSGSAVVLGNGPEVITAYHADKRFQKKLSRRALVA